LDRAVDFKNRSLYREREICRVDDTVTVKPSNLQKFMVIPWKLPVSIGWINQSKMMMHPTKTLGDLGVLKAQLDLTMKGFS
jgi:hypothetical protein